MRNEEHIQVTRRELSRGPVEVLTHPSFGQIAVHRITGGTRLYGSEFQHNHFIRITVTESHLQRELSNDWPMGGARVMELDLSEAQWATFVSSMGQGSGTQCTLRATTTDQAIPEIAALVNRKRQFRDEYERQTQDGIGVLEELVLSIEDNRSLSAAQKKKMAGSVRSAIAHLRENANFRHQQYEEFLEKTTEAAKAEIHGYVSGTLQRIGLDALRESPIQITGDPQ